MYKFVNIQVEVDDTLNNNNANNNIRHISTMPRQHTHKGGGNKGRKFSQPNSSSKINLEPTKSSILSSNRYIGQSSGKSFPGNQSGSTTTNIANSKGKLKWSLKGIPL